MKPFRRYAARILSVAGIAGIIVGLAGMYVTDGTQTWYVSPTVEKAIRRGASDYGLPASLLAAFTAYESGFNPKARNLTPYEDSVGLLQLNRDGGLGTGYTVAQLENPYFNVAIGAAQIRAALNGGYSLYDAMWPWQSTRPLAWPLYARWEREGVWNRGEAPSNDVPADKTWQVFPVLLAGAFLAALIVFR